MPVRARAVAGVAQHAGRQVERDRRARPAPTASASTSPTPQPTSRIAPARDVAEQVGVGLAQPLRAPDEVGVAEELAVLGLIVVGVGVPPAAVGAHGCRVASPGAAPTPTAGLLRLHDRGSVPAPAGPRRAADGKCRRCRRPSRVAPALASRWRPLERIVGVQSAADAVRAGSEQRGDRAGAAAGRLS